MSSGPALLKVRIVKCTSYVLLTRVDGFEFSLERGLSVLDAAAPVGTVDGVGVGLALRTRGVHVVLVLVRDWVELLLRRAEPVIGSSASDAARREEDKQHKILRRHRFLVQSSR